MKLLLINTAAEPAIAAVAVDGGVTAQREIADRHRLSEQLLSQVDAVLQQSGTPTNTLDGIAVVNGPGTFTGLRMGIALANGLAFGANLPLVSVAAELAETVEGFASYAGEQVTNGDTVRSVRPEYGREPTITLPKSAG